ncbi:MAG: hypothetical protein RR653_01490 [Clostridia bacterium]
MKKLLRVLSLCLVMAMLLTCLTLPAVAENLNAGREKVNIRFAQFGNSIDDPDGMANDPIKKMLEDTVNCTIEYDTGTDGFDDRMQTELAVGAAPDLFPTWGESEKILKWIADEAVVNVGALVAAEPDRYPTLAKIMSDPNYKAYNKLYSGDENAAYAIYSIAAFAQPTFSGVPTYNKAVLDQVNEGKTPATVEEFIDYANKAGAAGITGWWPRNNKLTNWNEIDKTLAAPQGTTIIAPQGDAWNGFIQTAEDTWKLATTSDQSKEVVKQLAELYKSNGLSQGVGIKGDFDDAYAEFGTGKIGAANFGFGYPAQYRDFYNTCWAAANPDTAKPEDLVLGTALTSNGEYGKTYSTYMWMGAHYFIPSTCKYPDRVLDLVEYIASADGQKLLFQGIEGQQFTMEGETPVYDIQKWVDVNKAYGYPDPDRAHYVWFSYLFSGTEYRCDFAGEKGWWDVVTSPYDNTNDWASEADKALVDYAKGVISGFVDSVMVKLPSYYAMLAMPPEANDIRTKMQDISNRYLTAMIGGQMDIETEWPNYVKEYEDAGAAQLEQMLNDAIVAAK